MTDIPPIGSPSQAASVLSRWPAGPPSATPAAAGMDQVEISEEAQLLSSLENGSDIRVDKVAEIRRQIQQGTYETPERIQATVEKLLVILRLPEKSD